jgi:hypothetical protein
MPASPREIRAQTRLAATAHATHVAVLLVHVDATIFPGWSPDVCGSMTLRPRGTLSAHTSGCPAVVSPLSSQPVMHTRLALLDGGGTPTEGEAGSVRLPGPPPETGERNRRMALQAFPDQPVPGPQRDYVGYGRHIPKVRWPDNARVAINLVLNYEEGSEYTHPAGDQKNDGLTEIPYVMAAAYRDLAAESVYEYGSRAGVWRVQRLIDGYKLPLTCFAAATALERNREVAAWLQEAGHEPCSHGWRWEEVWMLSREDEYQHMLWAIASFQDTVGQRPRGWYCRSLNL